MKKDKNRENNIFMVEETESKFNIFSKFNLPIAGKKSKFNLKNIFKKAAAIGSAILMFASNTVGVFASSQKQYNNKSTNIVEDIENIDTMNNFKNMYKYNTYKKTIENRIDEIISQNGNSQELKDVLNNMIKEINENYDNNICLSFGERKSKESYIDELLNILENDINGVYVINKNETNIDNRVKKMLEQDNLGITEEDKDGNKKIYIVDNGEDIKDNNFMSMIITHEISHVEQKINSNNNGYIGPQSAKILLSLQEGLAVFEQTKIQNNIQRAISYPENENIYIKLAYIIGEEKLKNYINTESNIPIDQFLTDSLDNKYGKGTGEKLLNELIKISPCLLKDYSDTFSKYETKESVQKEIDYLNGELAKKENINKKAEIEKGIRRCEIFSKSLENIKLDKNGIATKESIRNSIKEFEGYFLNTFLEKKINSISSKEETINGLKEYYTYKKLCLSNKNGEISKEYINKSDFDNMPIDKIEMELYNKVKKYGFLYDKSIFEIMLKTQVYDIMNTWFVSNEINKDKYFAFTDGYSISIVKQQQNDNIEIENLKLSENQKSFLFSDKKDKFKNLFIDQTNDNLKINGSLFCVQEKDNFCITMNKIMNDNSEMNITDIVKQQKEYYQTSDTSITDTVKQQKEYYQKSNANITDTVKQQEEYYETSETSIVDIVRQQKEYYKNNKKGEEIEK